MEPEMGKDSAEVASIRRSSRMFVREVGFMTQEVWSAGITHSEFHVLLEVFQNPGLKASELSEILKLDKSTVSRILASLRKDKLVESHEDPLDARKKVLRLTHKGLEKFQYVESIANSQVKSALALLPEQDRLQLSRSLNLYANALKKANRKAHYSIRKIESKDNEALRSIIWKVLEEHDGTGPGFAVHDQEMQDLYKKYSQSGWCYLVIEGPNGVVGGGGIGPLEGGEEQVSEVKKMYSLPEIRGLGLGSDVLSQLLDFAQSFGYQKCYLETLNRMHAAQRLYERFGFKVIERPLGDTGHFACDRFYFKDFSDFSEQGLLGAS